MFIQPFSLLLRVLVLVIFGLVAGCASLQPLSQWQSQASSLAEVKHCLVVVLISDQKARKRHEAEWVLTLRRQGIQAAPSYAIVENINDVNIANLAPFGQSHGVDTLIVASVSLASLMQDGQKTLDDFLNDQMILGLDVFMPQLEEVQVDVSTFALANGRMLWRNLYKVSVVSGTINWQAVANASVKGMMKAGLAPLPEPEETADHSSKASSL